MNKVPWDLHHFVIYTDCLYPKIILSSEMWMFEDNYAV